MRLFLGGIAFLVIGYFLYGRLVESIFGPDDRETPAKKNADGVDYVVLPRWKNMLIQLLNIAGVGPVIGVILGIKFGVIALIIIPVGCVLMGAVHDMAAGMMSIRDNGANLPKIVQANLGKVYNWVFEWFMVILLLLVVAVFINTPAQLIDTTVKKFTAKTEKVVPAQEQAAEVEQAVSDASAAVQTQADAQAQTAEVEQTVSGAAADAQKEIVKVEQTVSGAAADAQKEIVKVEQAVSDASAAVQTQADAQKAASKEKPKASDSKFYFWLAVVAIFIYYIIATMFPVDAIIGKVYPFFGAMLLIGTLAIFIALLVEGFKNPSIMQESLEFQERMWKSDTHPVFPLLFVTIACGIISGFHATQSPIIARTMKTEREARSDFYGMMIVEGIIAMIWAVGGLAIYNLKPEFMSKGGPVVLCEITSKFLGSWMGTITVLAVVILAVTSGDTALRSTRLSLAEMLHIPQKSFLPRFLTCLPLILLVAGLLAWSNTDATTFNKLWNYFAWGNQVLAATTLMAATVWLLRRGKKAASLVTLFPGMFMTAVIVTFIVWTSGKGGQPAGLFFFTKAGGLPYDVSLVVGIVVAFLFAGFALLQGRKKVPAEELAPAKFNGFDPTAYVVLTIVMAVILWMMSPYF